MKKVCVVFFVFLFCSTLLAQTRQPVFSEKAPKWASETHFVEGNNHYFVGRSSKQSKLEESISRALANALTLVSKYVKADIKSLSKVYEEDFGGDSSATVVRDVFSERGAQITVRNYIKESYSEKFVAGVETFYESVVKIAVSSEDLKLMGIKATGITAWDLKTSRCSGDQAEELEMMFKEAASRLNWKLQRESSGAPDFSAKFPKTAYFAEANAKCSGNSVNFSIERYDLVENMVVNYAYSKANTLSDLKNDLFNSLQIYIPMVDFPEYPDTKNISVFNSVPADLKLLYSKAVEAEQKGRLDSEKAENLWKKIAEYNSSANPFRSLAQNRVTFYQKMSDAVSRLSPAEKKEFDILMKTAKSHAVNIRMLSKNLASYIDSFGAWAGRDKVGEIIDSVSNKEKKAALWKAVFEDSREVQNWERSCRQGDPAKCYLLSMKNDGESTSLKKFACDKKVEKACFDLYSDAVRDNNGGRAALFAEKSCYLGNKHSCALAAQILIDGELNADKDLKKSITLLADSCEAKSGESCWMLGQMYQKGIANIKMSMPKAIDFYKKGCDFGYEKSCNAY